MAQSFALQARSLPPASSNRAASPRSPVIRPSHRATRRFLAHTGVHASSLAAEDGEVDELFEEPEFEDASAPSSGLSTQQVSSVLSMLCEETDIMQIELKMGDFELFAQRSIKGAASASPSAAPAASSAVDTPFSPPLSPQQNMGQPQAPPPNPTQSVMTVDDEVDESMIFIESPKVGVFRRGRYAKGKRIGKGNVCEPGDEVKKGQTLAYVEQLGTFVPVESPQAGQIATFSCDEGESVEYKQHVIELAPFFGGHIIGESKWN